MKHIATLFIFFFTFIYNFLPLNAQWNHLPGFSGQQLLSMTEKDTCIFVGTDFQGVFRTTDFENSWTQTNSGLTQLGIKTFCLSGIDLFVGTFSGIFKSTNNGSTWNSSGLANVIVEEIISDGIYIFAGTDLGVYRSSDNGNTWSLKNNGITNTNVHTLYFHGSHIIAGTWGDREGIFISSDSGETWNLSNSGLTSFDVSAFTSIGTELFAGTNSDGIFRSTDNGMNWIQSNSGLTNGTIGKLVATGKNMFAATYGGGIFLTTNRGITWTPVNTGLPNLYIGPLAIIGSYLYAGSFGDGVFRRQLGTMPIVYNDTASLSFTTGWNLVSLPFIPYFSAPDSLFSNNQSVFEFNNNTKTYTSPADVNYGKGYWTYHFEEEISTIYGRLVDSTILYVPNAGWVLFGSQYLNTSAANLISSPPGSILGDIYRFNGNLGTYQQAAQIVPGEAYWVFVTQPCKLILP